ncbi:hypothetical protein [Marinobacter sp. SS8-8]|uniref:hypothetical protein n=1 Tax=Marinobacter sp. SS8-8 TaxID=3050452 RepID=UPI0026E0C338|nr:hypothetical protein [Marinobacter sp. SS8-8]|tara:strand:+ start:2026 stop:2286 length:261 start_codon:yes stop_codon:yes gene_type:complete
MSLIAVCSESKFDEVRQLGADQVIARGQSLLDVLEKDSVQVVADLVAGPQWPSGSPASWRLRSPARIFNWQVRSPASRAFAGLNVS